MAVVIAVGCFALGLLANAVSSTWAYMSLDWKLGNLNHLREQRALSRNIPDTPDGPERQKLKARLEIEKTEVDFANVKSTKFAGKALLAHWISLLAFLAGVLVGGASFLGML